VAGTVTPLAVLLLERTIVSPPVGAALEIVTIPAEEAPPYTAVGFNNIPTKVGAVTARVAVVEVEPSVPVIVADMLEATGVVEALNPAEV